MRHLNLFVFVEAIFEPPLTVKYKFKFFWSSNFLLVGGRLAGAFGQWLVGRWLVSQLDGGRW